MKFYVERDDLSDGQIVKLLELHLADMLLHSPPESVHALDPAALAAPEISFWRARSGDRLAGCGALKELSSTHAELKSMKTDPEFARQGVASNILQAMLAEAERRGYQRVSLETGSMAVFEPARRLYEKFGFAECGPFADYQLDPHSTFMTKYLSST
jgi:putative acetyltransferase